MLREHLRLIHIRSDVERKRLFGLPPEARAGAAAGTGIYTFDTNAQSLTGTFSIPNVTVTGITLTNNNTLTVPIGSCRLPLIP